VKKQQNGLVPIDQLLKNPDLSPTMKAALEVIRPSPFKLLLPAAKQSAAAAGAGDGGVGGPPAAKVPRKEEPSASAASTPAPAEDAAAAEVTQLIEQLVDLGTVETIKKALPQVVFYDHSSLSIIREMEGIYFKNSS
jgi:hypothetical protein